jgi:hypothetical protein
VGDGWGATITTEGGDPRSFHPVEDPLSVLVWGGDRGHPSFLEGYTMRWYAERDDPPRVPDLIAPLLLRLQIKPGTSA